MANEEHLDAETRVSLGIPLLINQPARPELRYDFAVDNSHIEIALWKSIVY